MNLEKAKDILENCISDYVISEYCSKCGDFQICENKNEDCYFIQAIDTVLQALEEREMLYIKLLAKGINESISYNKKNEEELELLNDGWKIREKELLNIIKLMAEKINQAYFEENDFYTWFEKEFGIIPKGHYEEKIINHFMKLTKEDK